MRRTAQKMKYSTKVFFSKCDQIRNFLQIWSHLLNKSLMENLIFCAVSVPKGNSKFEILLVKIFSLKQKPNKAVKATIEKIKFYVSKKTASFSFRQVLCKR